MSQAALRKESGLRKESAFRKESPQSRILRSKRDSILALASQRGISKIRVFGSVARGDARPDSDVDLLVDVEPGYGLLELGSFLMELRDLLGFPVDLVTEAGLRPRIRQDVLAEAIPL